MKFTEKELDAMKAAVARAEERTSAEIVPYVVPASDWYPVAIWRGAGVGVLVGLALALLAFQFYGGWSLGWLFTGWGTALLILGTGVVGALLGAFVPPLKRLLAGDARMSTLVHLRAMQAFVEEEVFATRDRTGVLVFMSLFEHRIEIVADTGINQRVESEDWGDIVARIRDGIRSGKLFEGLVEAFDMCGELLEKKGLEIRHDDRNELGDELRARR
ncbi:MAG TPA: hypothetical protein VF190_02665 [Rhodothermales bacterium]